MSRNLRPVILDGNSYIDSLSNHWSTYAITHARFRDTEYEVPAKKGLFSKYTKNVNITLQSALQHHVLQTPSLKVFLN